jgi:hypothetical protein
MVACVAGDGKTFEELVAVRVRFICAQRLVHYTILDVKPLVRALTRRITSSIYPISPAD